MLAHPNGQVEIRGGLNLSPISTNFFFLSKNTLIYMLQAKICEAD